MEQWITQELETTQLGDARRTKRLIKIVENLSAKPEASVPQASGTWAETKATYDFWDSPYIKPSMIRLLTYRWDNGVSLHSLRTGSTMGYH
jgi:Transposase DNA-binding